MPIMWSRIHAELGTSPTPLTYEMVRQAVEQGMAEAEDLDWKQSLPQGPEKKWWEFAKDVAAMANTGGGLIVFGVSDANERAVDLLGVANSQSERQTLTNYAMRWVRPVIGELVIEPLDDVQGGRGLIAVFVPASPDAPHVIGEKNEMGVPYRYGPHTNWMSESELERSYRDRFSRRADDRVALAAMIEGFVPELNQDEGVWLTIAARPILSPPPRAPQPDRQNATTAMLESLSLAEEITGCAADRFQLLLGLGDGAVLSPRTGLRRWRFRSNHHNVDPHALVDWSLVELHHNGGVALAVELTRIPRRTNLNVAEKADVYQVPVRFMDLLVGAGVALASTHVRRLGGTGTILIRATLYISGMSPKPLIAVEELAPGIGRLDRVDDSWPVRAPAAVEGAFAAVSETSALRDAARQLAEDLNQQFGKPSSSLRG